MFGDVNSILGSDSREDTPVKTSLINVDAAKNARGRRPGQTIQFKKPSGMHREVYNLLKAGESGAADLSSVMPTESKQGYMNQKAKMGLRKVRRHKWTPFTNEARSDGLQLYHWQRVDKIETQAPYPFAKFNKVMSIPTFSDEEYDSILKIDSWTKEETNYLLEICKQFDLRWPVIMDRYDKSKFGKDRSMEDLKERYYSIVSEVNLLRDHKAEQICYDAEHERMRKEQLIIQWNLTNDELEEIETLESELKRIESRKRERERKAQNLQNLLTMGDKPLASPSVSSSGMSPAGKKKSSTIARVKAPAPVPIINPLDLGASSLRFSEFRSAGAHLRSQEMKLPTNIGQKKMKNIETVIDKLKLDMNPMADEEIVAAYNEFRSQIVMLGELKGALQAAEFELETIRTRQMQGGKECLELEPRMRISTLLEGGVEEGAMSGEGAPLSRRRVSSHIQLNPLSNLPMARKRKVTGLSVPPLQMDLKRPRNM